MPFCSKRFMTLVTRARETRPAGMDFNDRLFLTEWHTHALPVREALFHVGQFLRRSPDNERHKVIAHYVSP